MLTQWPGPGAAEGEEERAGAAGAAAMALLPARRALLAAALGPAGRRRLPRHHGNRCLSRPPGAGGEPEAEGPGRASAMLRHLLLKLRATGPVTVAEYMREALTNPGEVRAGPGRGLSSVAVCGPGLSNRSPVASPPAEQRPRHAA